MRKLTIGLVVAALVGVITGTFGFLTSCNKTKTSAVSYENAVATDEGLAVFKKAEQLLSEQSEYYIAGEGTVDAKKAGINLSTQKIYSVNARNNDDYLIESNSYSSLVKCATRAYSQADGTVKVYQGSKVSKDGSTAVWDAEKFKSYTAEEYFQDWGKPINGCFTYTFSEETVLSQEYLGTTEGYSQYHFVMDPESSTVDYRRQMKTISNLPDYPKMKTVEFVFTVDENGFIVSSSNYEIYTVKYSGFTADCVANITSYYYYGDVHIPSLTENSQYTGTGKANIPSMGGIEIEKEEVKPISKIIQGITSEPYDLFDADVSVKNPSGKEIARLSLGLGLDISDLDAVRLQGHLSSSEYGYNFSISFYIDLEEKVLYIYSDTVNCKYDVNNITDSVNYVINFVNQFMKNKIELNLSMPELNLDSLMDDLGKSCTETVLSDGSFVWNLDLSSLVDGLKATVRGKKDTYEVTNISIPSFAVRGYDISLDCDVTTLEETPIQDLTCDKEKTADVSDTLKIIDYLQTLVDSKKFGLNVKAVKYDSEGNEQYLFDVDADLDIASSSYYADVKIQGNSDYDICLGYNNEGVYFSLNDQLKGRVEKTTIDKLIDYAKTYLNDEEFMNTLKSKLNLNSDSLDLVSALKEGRLSELSGNALDFVYDIDGLDVKVDLGIVGLNGSAELKMSSKGEGIEYLKADIYINGELLSVNATLDDFSSCPSYNNDDYFDFSSVDELKDSLDVAKWFLQIFDDKRIALKASASKKDAEGNETYSFSADGQYDFANYNFLTDFVFTDDNGSHDIQLGYSSQDAYLSYQDKLKGRVSHSAIQELIDYVFSVVDDKEFMDRIISSFTTTEESLDLVSALKKMDFDAVPDGALKFVKDVNGLYVKVDLAVVNLEGEVEFKMKPNQEGFDYLNFSIVNNGETLSVKIENGEIKDIPSYSQDDYMDFSSLPRLIKMAKQSVFDNNYAHVSGKVNVDVPVISTLYGDIDVGVDAYVRIGENIKDIDAIVTLDIPIMSLVTNDKDDFDYPSVDGYSLSSVESRKTTLYIHGDSIIFERVDGLKYGSGFLNLTKTSFTCTTYRKYTFSELKDNYMDAIYYAAGMTDFAKNLINKAIDSASSSDELNDYSQIVTKYEFSENNPGATYDITCNLGGIIHSDTLGEVEGTIKDNGTTLSYLYAKTTISSLVTITADLNLEFTKENSRFDSFDSFIASYSGNSSIVKA